VGLVWLWVASVMIAVVDKDLLSHMCEQQYNRATSNAPNNAQLHKTDPQPTNPVNAPNNAQTKGN